jgi:hypothetical protein
MGNLRNRTVLVALASVLSLVAAGCGSDDGVSPTALTQSAADDIALQIGQSMAAGNGGTMAEINVAAGSVPSAPAGSFEAAAETSFTIGAITYTFTRAFYDQGGAELPGYGPTAVRLAATSRATGVIEHTLFEATVGHAGVLDVTGIQPEADTLELNGGSHDTLQTQFQSMDGARTRYFYWRGDLDYEDVHLLKDRSVNPWPLDGTAVWMVSADRLRSNQVTDVEAHLEVTVIVTFNGTADPEILVNGRFRYRINLQSGAATRV